jgi:hypothetical protein
VGSPGTSGSSGASGTSGSSGTSVSVSGTTNQLVKFATASTLGATSTPIYESGSAFIGIGVTSSLVSRLQVYRSGSNVSVLKVDGGSGTLFEVTDNLSGSLFNVNDITGLPLFEVFSNNRIVAGKYAANDLVISGSRVGIGTATPGAKLQVIGNISGSQFTSSRRNAVGFLGTSSYARRSLTASFALNASSGGTTLRTGSTYPITSSFARRAITASYALASAGGGGSGTVSSGTTNRLAKYTGATTVGSSAVIYESGSAFVGIGVTSSLVSSLQVYRSGSNASVLKVDGGSGTLFEVTDNLSGSLFNVNDITGLPIFEVFSNNRIVAGKYAANDLVISGSRVGIGTATPSAKLQVIGNISGSQFTSSRRNAVGFFGTSSYARRALTASFALNASSGGTTLRTGSTYPITSSFARRAITASYALASAGGGGSGTISSGTTNRLAKYTGATTVGQSFSPIFESGSAFVGVGPISTSLVSRLQVFRSGSNASVLKVDGGSGTLFEVTDNLSGSLFSVNTIAGFPILEVFSNNRMVAGAYGTNALVVSASSVGIGTTTPSAKLHIQGNVSGSQFTSSRRNAIGFLGTSSYARRALTASYALNASGGGGGSTLRTGSTYPITASKTSAIGAGTTNRFVKYNNASAVGQTFTPIFESGSAFIGIGAISSSLVSRLQVYRSGSNASVLKVDGGSGTLFEVTDNLSGSLFSVNTIAGFPILEVFSNNRMVAGAYGTNALVVSASSVGIGIATPSAKLHIQGNISGSQFTSSRRNAIGFSGTASYARRALSASYVLGGAAGSSGTSGTSGASGTSGSSGTSGTSGTSGSSGTSGVGSPGSSGTSGTSSTPALSLAQTFVLTASVSQLKLTQSAANNDQILVILDGLVQSRINSYTVSGSTLTLTENAPSGSNVDIRYLGGGSSVSSSYALTSSFSSTSAPRTAIYRYGTTSVVNPGGYANTVVKYDTAVTDSTGWYNNTTGRFTPTVAGWYQVSAGARVYGGSAAAEGYFTLLKNADQIAIVGGIGNVFGFISILVYFNGSTDYISFCSNMSAAITNAQNSGTTPFTMVYMTS